MRIALVALCLSCAASQGPSPTQALIERAAAQAGVPPALLVSLAYVDSRLIMNAPSADSGYGLLHLVDRDDAPDAISLARAAALSGIPPELLKSDPYSNALGAALLLREQGDLLFRQYKDLDEHRIGDWWQAVMRLSGSTNAFVANGYAAQVYRLLRDGLTVHAEDGMVSLDAQEIGTTQALTADLSPDSSGQFCPGGACVAYVPASTSNYNAGRDETVSKVVIHDMEGSYSGSINWFENPSAQASAHYMVRSSDGQITQMVLDQDTAWHAGNHVINNSSIGIEHEGYAHTGSQWFTEAMYQSSAALARWICDTYGIARDRTHIIGHYEVPDTSHAGWYGGASNHHDPCDGWAGNPTWHNVSACYWNWDHYMALVVGTGPNGTLTGFVGDNCCGIGAGKKALAGATVALEGTNLSATTDASGTYSFSLPAGNYTPRASLNGYGSADHTSLGAGYPATLAVTAGGTTWGSIVLAKTAPPPPAPPPNPPPPAVTAPVLTILTPADNSTVVSTPLTLKGTVSDGSVTSVTVSGQTVAASGGAFTASIDLTAGANVITASATNSGGTGSATVHVTYAPPQTGIAGHVNGPSGPIANAGLSLTPGSAQTTTAADGSYAFTLTAGTYTLKLDADGYAQQTQPVTIPQGQVITRDFALTASTPPATPHIRVDSPSENEMLSANSVLVSGVAEVPDLKSLAIGDELVSFDATGAFGVMVSLNEGPNQLVITATRGDGTTVAATVDVELQPVALSRAGGCESFDGAAWLSLLGLAVAARRKRTGSRA